MENVVNGMSIADLLALSKKIEKEQRKNNPKAHHAEYVKNWRKTKKEELRADPDFIQDQLRIQEERKNRRDGVLAKLQVRKEKRELRRKLKEERLESAKQKANAYKDFVNECYKIVGIEEPIHYHSIYLRERKNGEVVTHYKVVVNYFDKHNKNKFKTITKITNQDIPIDPKEQAKLIVISILTEIEEDRSAPKEVVSNICDDDIDPENYDDFDFGDF